MTCGTGILKKTRNKFERKIQRQLRQAKCSFTYESERIPYVLAKHYVPDFIVATSSGLLYIECKGYLRPEDKSKLSAVKRQHPNKDLRIVFYARSKTNIKWAERNGFKYCIGKIPEEWLNAV